MNDNEVEVENTENTVNTEPNKAVTDSHVLTHASSDTTTPNESTDKGGEDETKEEPQEGSNIPALLFDAIETLATATCTIVLLFLFVFRIAIVSGPSMNNTLFDGDILIVSDVAFEPKYGDIVVFQKLKSRLGDEAVVKRVIATEYQTVDIDFEKWIVTVDGVPIDESDYRYLALDSVRTSDLTFPITLGEGELFVMGDNRNHSTDSRSSDVGIIDKRSVFGRVILRISPLTEFKVFKRFD